MFLRKYFRELLKEKINGADVIFVFLCLLISVILIFIPTKFDDAIVSDAYPAKAEIVEVDNSGLHTIGIIHTGAQVLKLRIKDGKFKGKEFVSINHLLGKMEIDKIYRVGEDVFSVLEISDGKPIAIKVIDRYRINLQILLLTMFAGFLIIYAGWTGFKAVVSFIFSAAIIWKVLLTGYLSYYPPITLSLIVTAIMTSVTIFSCCRAFQKKE